MQKRKDRRFKQWNRTTITPLEGGPGPGGAAEIEAFTYDLSLGGARIHTMERFEVGTWLRLRIVLARTRDSVSLEGEVKWLRQHPSENVFEMGVEFRHETPQTFMSLMKDLHDEQFAPAPHEAEPDAVRPDAPSESSPLSRS